MEYTVKWDDFSMANVFMTCTKCGHKWNDRRSFLSDPAIDVIGYQADFRELTEGLFIFHHTCGATIKIKAQFFIDLYSGPIFQEKLTHREECFGYCFVRVNMEPCANKCECSYVRETLQVIRNWQKDIDEDRP